MSVLDVLFPVSLRYVYSKCEILCIMFCLFLSPLAQNAGEDVALPWRPSKMLEIRDGVWNRVLFKT